MKSFRGDKGVQSYRSRTKDGDDVGLDAGARPRDPASEAGAGGKPRVHGATSLRLADAARSNSSFRMMWHRVDFVRFSARHDGCGMVQIGTSLPEEVAAFAAAYTNVILIPGPSFAVVCEAGLSANRREANLVAVGVACGAGVLATVILQAASWLRSEPGLAAAGRVCCAVILLVMGFRMLRRSLRGIRRAEPEASATVARKRFVTGFVAAASNPVSFASFTTAALTVDRVGHGTDCAVVSFTIFLMAAGWFNTLAIVSSQPLLTTHYGRVATALGAVMGCVLMAKAFSFLLATL